MTKKCSCRATVSLEWGSHRHEHSIQRFIREEFEVGNAGAVAGYDPITLRRKEFYFAKPVVYELSQSIFFPQSGHISLGTHPLKESIPWNYPLHRIARSGAQEPVRVIDGANATALSLQKNYYHFLLEDLPRLLVLIENRAIRRVFVPDTLLPRYVMEVLEYLGLELTTVAEPVRLENLSFLAQMGYPGVVHPFAQELVRQKFLSESKILSRNRRIYVSRRLSSRSFSSELRLQNFLIHHGFEVALLEKMSVREQVQLFSETEHVVAPHGAALANIVFMRDNQKVTEIMYRGFANPVYQLLSGDRLRFSRVLYSRGDQVYPLVRHQLRLLS